LAGFLLSADFSSFFGFSSFLVSVFGFVFSRGFSCSPSVLASSFADSVFSSSFGFS
jgi:hypothetical protein